MKITHPEEPHMRPSPRTHWLIQPINLFPDVDADPLPRLAKRRGCV